MSKYFVVVAIVLAACAPSLVDDTEPMIAGDLADYALSIEEFPQHGELFFVSSIVNLDIAYLKASAPTNIALAYEESDQSDGLRARYELKDRNRFPGTQIFLHIERFASVAGAESFFDEEIFELFRFADYPSQSIDLGPAQQANLYEISFPGPSINDPNRVWMGIHFQYANTNTFIFGAGDAELINAAFIEELASIVLEKMTANNP